MSTTTATVTLTTRATQMVSASDSDWPDLVASEGSEHRALNLEGEDNLPERVNTYLDKSRRTLLAWQGLIVMPCFMPGDFMRLYVTIRQPYKVPFLKVRNDKRRKTRAEISAKESKERSQKKEEASLF